MTARDDAIEAMEDAIVRQEDEWSGSPAHQLALVALAAVPPRVLARLAIESHVFWCGNCDGRKCMACVWREEHDACEDDCPDCCLPPDGSYQTVPTFGSVLKQGWAKK